MPDPRSKPNGDRVRFWFVVLAFAIVIGTALFLYVSNLVFGGDHLRDLGVTLSPSHSSGN